MVGVQGPRENIKETKDKNDEKTSECSPHLCAAAELCNSGVAYKGAETANTPAQAEKMHDPAACNITPVVLVRGMDMMGLYIDKDTENERNALNFSIKDLLFMLCKGIYGAVKEKNFDPFAQAVIDYAAKIA